MLTPLWKTLLATILLSAAVCAAYVPPPPPPPLHAGFLAVFGDSYSDVGNCRDFTSGKASYWNGRFTNGPNWTDYLSSRFRLPVFNFAVGGALINNSLVPQPPANQASSSSSSSSSQSSGGGQFSSSPASMGMMPCISSQISAFTNNPLYTEHVPTTTAIIEVGGNDFFWLLGNNQTGPVGQDVQDHFVDSATATLISGAQKLVNSGIRRVVVWNLGNIGGSFMASSLDDSIAANISSRFNQLLASRFDEFRGANNGRLDLATIFDSLAFSSIVKSPKVVSAIGVTHTSGFCVSDSGFFSYSSAKVCSDPSTYFYYDWAHFTTKIHALYGFMIANILANPTFRVSEDALLDIARQYNVANLTAQNNPFIDAWGNVNPQISWL
ncbi:hypothetical protein EV182_000439 [Spiromyces aspiralis]|uniref:Uncharacterized protein n=1 Tax=Spiromyces aspiralis TaxID=68401 RepID=A0ACC1I0I9_9FUNG|nr:hypothetical protein EV182_000439 [Spiromyces aspiralis]